MGKLNIALPKGTLRNQIQFLLIKHPELSRGEMATLLGKSVGTIYSYVCEIKKSQEKEIGKIEALEKKKVVSNAELEQQALEIFENREELETTATTKTDIWNEQTEVIEFADEPAPTPPLPQASVPVAVSATQPVQQPVQQVLVDKAPENLELSLTGINGGHLKKLLFELLNNSVSEDAKYSFKFSLERVK